MLLPPLAARQPTSVLAASLALQLALPTVLSVSCTDILPRTQVHFFSEIGYQHGNLVNCPAAHNDRWGASAAAVYHAANAGVLCNS